MAKRPKKGARSGRGRGRPPADYDRWQLSLRGRQEDRDRLLEVRAKLDVELSESELARLAFRAGLELVAREGVAATRAPDPKRIRAKP